ncbi:hypothetical protein F4861DRAFT_124502 [Xylaria intraflava]|nr:hypothetical protein F4861DRAFT_124502 [Xylaria intraflava]
MARDEYIVPESNPLSEAQAQLYTSLEQYNSELRRRKLPSIILAALIVLFLTSATSIPLAVALMVKAAEIEKAISLPRDLVFFSGILSLLYICLHIRGARKDYRREGMGPPQQYGHYLHASALLVARIGIVTWIAALVATAVLMAKTVRFHGLSGRVSVVNLMLCTSAIPPFLIISITIERNSTPFATAAISKESFLTYRVRDFDDDLVADVSVSRRASMLQRKQSECGSVLTLPTEEIFRLGAPREDEKVSAPPEPESAGVPEPVVPDDTAAVEPPPVPPIPLPQQTYYPGGWRAEWDDGRGASRMSRNSMDAHASSSISSSIEPSPPAPKISQPPAEPATCAGPYNGRRARSLGRSNLSTVRYAAAPEIAVRQSIKVVPNPAFVADGVKKPDAAARVRGSEELRRNPSNFSRPIRSPETRDSGIEV